LQKVKLTFGEIMKTSLTPLTRHLRHIFAASAALSFLAFNTAVAQEQSAQADEAAEDVEKICGCRHPSSTPFCGRITRAN